MTGWTLIKPLIIFFFWAGLFSIKPPRCCSGYFRIVSIYYLSKIPFKQGCFPHNRPKSYSCQRELFIKRTLSGKRTYELMSGIKWWREGKCHLALGAETDQKPWPGGENWQRAGAADPRPGRSLSATFRLQSISNWLALCQELGPGLRWFLSFFFSLLFSWFNVKHSQVLSRTIRSFVSP